MEWTEGVKQLEIELILDSLIFRFVDILFLIVLN